VKLFIYLILIGMNKIIVPKKSCCFSVYLSLFFLFAALASVAQTPGKTEITRWQDGKKAAVSLTYDDGSRNQFKYVLPIMERLKLPGTFFIITGPVIGSVHPPKFIGRPVNKIISETENVATNTNNFFERASASLYLGYAGTLPYYNKADEFYE
jgi:hypothetical protein